MNLPALSVPLAPRISLRDYLGAYLARREKSSASFRYEKPRLMRFLGWTQAREIEYPDQVGLDVQEEFVGYLREKDMSVGSIRAHLLFLRHALPMLPKLPLPRAEESTFKILTEEEEADLLRAAKGTPIELPLILSLDAGLRIGEVAECKEEWLDVQARVVRIPAVTEDGWRTKGRKGRAVAMTPRLEAHAWQFVDPISPSKRMLDYWLGKATAKAEIKLTWHDLRRTWATRLACKGVPVHILQRLLGHSSLETTQHYLRTTEEEAIQEMRRICG